MYESLQKRSSQVEFKPPNETQSINNTIHIDLSEQITNENFQKLLSLLDHIKSVKKIVSYFQNLAKADKEFSEIVARSRPRFFVRMIDEAKNNAHRQVDIYAMLLDFFDRVTITKDIMESTMMMTLIKDITNNRSIPDNLVKKAKNLRKQLDEICEGNYYHGKDSKGHDSPSRNRLPLKDDSYRKEGYQNDQRQDDRRYEENNNREQLKNSNLSREVFLGELSRQQSRDTEVIVLSPRLENSYSDDRKYLDSREKEYRPPDKSLERRDIERSHSDRPPERHSSSHSQPSRSHDHNSRDHYSKDSRRDSRDRSRDGHSKDPHYSRDHQSRDYHSRDHHSRDHHSRDHSRDHHSRDHHSRDHHSRDHHSRDYDRRDRSSRHSRSRDRDYHRSKDYRNHESERSRDRESRHDRNDRPKDYTNSDWPRYDPDKKYHESLKDTRFEERKSPDRKSPHNISHERRPEYDPERDFKPIEPRQEEKRVQLPDKKQISFFNLENNTNATINKQLNETRGLDLFQNIPIKIENSDVSILKKDSLGSIKREHVEACDKIDEKNKDKIFNNQINGSMNSFLALEKRPSKSSFSNNSSLNVSKTDINQKPKITFINLEDPIPEENNREEKSFKNSYEKALPPTNTTFEKISPKEKLNSKIVENIPTLTNKDPLSKDNVFPGTFSLKPLEISQEDKFSLSRNDSHFSHDSRDSYSRHDKYRDNSDKGYSSRSTSYRHRSDSSRHRDYDRHDRKYRDSRERSSHHRDYRDHRDRSSSGGRYKSFSSRGSRGFRGSRGDRGSRGGRGIRGMRGSSRGSRGRGGSRGRDSSRGARGGFRTGFKSREGSTREKSLGQDRKPAKDKTFKQKKILKRRYVKKNVSFPEDRQLKRVIFFKSTNEANHPPLSRDEIAPKIDMMAHSRFEDIKHKDIVMEAESLKTQHSQDSALIDPSRLNPKINWYKPKKMKIQQQPFEIKSKEAERFEDRILGKLQVAYFRNIPDAPGFQIENLNLFNPSQPKTIVLQNIGGDKEELEDQSKLVSGTSNEPIPLRGIMKKGKYNRQLISERRAQELNKEAANKRSENLSHPIEDLLFLDTVKSLVVSDKITHYRNVITEPNDQKAEAIGPAQLLGKRAALHPPPKAEEIIEPPLFIIDSLKPYKKVPCVFFHSPMGCNKGDQCSFIHHLRWAGRETPNMHRYVRAFHQLSQYPNQNEINVERLKNSLQHNFKGQFDPKRLDLPEDGVFQITGDSTLVLDMMKNFELSEAKKQIQNSKREIVPMIIDPNNFDPEKGPKAPVIFLPPERPPEEKFSFFP